MTSLISIPGLIFSSIARRVIATAIFASPVKIASYSCFKSAIEQFPSRREALFLSVRHRRKPILPGNEFIRVRAVTHLFDQLLCLLRQSIDLAAQLIEPSLFARYEPQFPGFGGARQFGPSAA